VVVFINDNQPWKRKRPKLKDPFHYSKKPASPPRTQKRKKRLALPLSICNLPPDSKP